MASLSPQLLKELGATASKADGLWVRKKAMYLLWFEYLAISPSYELARRVRAGETIPPTEMPADFEKVLAVYDDLGDVQRVLFHEWWQEVGLRHFGFTGKPPRVAKVGYVPHKRDGTPDLAPQLTKYFDQDWIDQGRQRVLLVAIPVGMPESKITQQIKNQLAKVKPERRKLIDPVVRYQLVGKRHHHDVMFRYLRMVYFHSSGLFGSIWRAAAQAQISDTYSSVLDPAEPTISKDSTYDREMLTIIGSRALLRARMMSENAARGIFPTHEKCDHALEFDRKALGRLIASRVKWKKNRLTQMGMEHSEIAQETE
jgi:hypothetical protein